MNERDLQLAEAINKIMVETNEPSVYLIHTKYTNVVRVNLVVLEAFLEIKAKKGIMITIDRPHQYVSHLMQLHEINQNNLSFIDAISAHSSDTKDGSADSVPQRGPFNIETLPEFLLNSEKENLGPLADLTGIGFIVIDNVSTLLIYNTTESVKRFFENYLRATKEFKPSTVLTVVVMDRDLQPVLFEFISGFSKKVLEVGPEMTVKIVREMGDLTKKIPSPVPQATLESDRSEQAVLKDKEAI